MRILTIIIIKKFIFFCCHYCAFNACFHAVYVKLPHTGAFFFCRRLPKCAELELMRPVRQLLLLCVYYWQWLWGLRLFFKRAATTDPLLPENAINYGWRDARRGAARYRVASPIRLCARSLARSRPGYDWLRVISLVPSVTNKYPVSRACLNDI